MHALVDAGGAQRNSAGRAVAAVDIAALGLLALAVAVYLTRSIGLASRAPFWMDEVLSVWTASRPSITGVWSALVGGSEFSPPAFDVLLHILRELGFTSPLSMRAPSIVATFAAACGVFVLVRRHSPISIAAVACAAVLSGGAFAYAVQARPYACSTAAIAWAVVLWEQYPAAGRATGKAITVGSLCALAVAFHFYALIPVGLLGLAETIRAVRHRPRAALLIAITLGAGSIMLWWPIAHAAAAWNNADVAASGFYASPTGDRLLRAYTVLMLPLTPAYLIAAIFVLALYRRGEAVRFDAPVKIALVACAVPIGVFLLGCIATHVFNQRYAVVATLGFAILISQLLRALGNIAPVLALGLLPLLTITPPPGGMVALPGLPEAIALANATPLDLPIATGDGLRFFELSGNQESAVADRLVYLRVPGPHDGSDLTNRHQVERWAAISPSLQVRDAAAFVCSTSRFLMFHDAHGDADDLPGWLTSVATVHWLAQAQHGLALVESRPCPDRKAGS